MDTFSDEELSIKISEGSRIKFQQEMTFENFMGQFQQNCHMILCIINGTILHYYPRGSKFPNNIRFDYKHRRGSITEYYFRDNDDETLYCVFGREAAKHFYPKINEVDEEKPRNRRIIEPIVSSNDIIIIDGRVKSTFSNYNYPVEVRTYK